MLRNSIFREMPPLTMLVLFIGMVFAALLFSSLLGILLLFILHGPGSLTAISDPTLYSDVSVVAQLKLLQIINQVFGLLLPALLFLLLIERNPGKLLSGKRNLPVFLLLSAVFMLISQPAIGWLGEMNERIDLPASFSRIEHWLLETEEKNSRLTEAFLATTSIPGFVVNILMIAILPALAEETVFRGVLQPVLAKLFRNRHAGILVAALIFAGIHLQFYGFLPRFALGLIFGYLFLWSSNLWLPIMAHFINNLLSVVVEFLYRRGYIEINASELGNTGNTAIIIMSVVLSAIILAWFFRNKAHNSPTLS